jgi:hypothetical protein
MHFQCGNFDGAIETGVQNKVITKQKLFFHLSNEADPIRTEADQRRTKAD